MKLFEKASSTNFYQKQFINHEYHERIKRQVISFISLCCEFQKNNKHCITGITKLALFIVLLLHTMSCVRLSKFEKNFLKCGNKFSFVISLWALWITTTGVKIQHLFNREHSIHVDILAFLMVKFHNEVFYRIVIKIMYYYH